MKHEGTTTVEYIKPEKQSNTLGAVGTALGGVALLGVAGNMIGNTVSRYGGAIANNIAGQNGALGFNPAASFVAPAAVAAAVAPALNGGGYVTEKEICLIRENAGKDSVIAQLTAEKYADNKIQEATEKLSAKYNKEIAVINNKVCNLETHAAVTATGFEDYKKFANRLYVHQPTAYMKDRIVTCEDSCDCNCNCGHGHRNC